MKLRDVHTGMLADSSRSISRASSGLSGSNNYTMPWSNDMSTAGGLASPIHQFRMLYGNG